MILACNIWFQTRHTNLYFLSQSTSDCIDHIFTSIPFGETFSCEPHPLTSVCKLMTSGLSSPSTCSCYNTRLFWISLSHFWFLNKFVMKDFCRGAAARVGGQIVGRQMLFIIHGGRLTELTALFTVQVRTVLHCWWVFDDCNIVHWHFLNIACSWV